MNIRPVSDLRNKYPEIENIVLGKNEPVFLTRNGRGSMVLLSLEQYSDLTEYIERKLDEADLAAKTDSRRFTADEVFSRVRRNMDEPEKTI